MPEAELRPQSDCRIAKVYSITSSALASKGMAARRVAKRLGGGQVEHKLQFGGPLYRQIPQACLTAQSLPGVDAT